jgi:ubiquinone/menaquinone biosynthesis C-methylase UbiE
MKNWLRKSFKSSKLFSFNQINRDEWVREQARKVRIGASVLDVGAGSCPYAHLFPHCHYKTQDLGILKDEQLRNGRYGTLDYVCDVTNIPVENDSFDAVLCTEVLEHLPEPMRALREFARILKPGGSLILTAPLGSGIHQEPYHFYGGFTPAWFQRFLAEAGFNNIVIEPNAGFFKFFSQESIRFIRMTRPFKLSMPFIVEFSWIPFWILLLPICGLLFPLLTSYLDRFDKERRFTVGYHVTANKS